MMELNLNFAGLVTIGMHNALSQVATEVKFYLNFFAADLIIVQSWYTKQFVHNYVKTSKVVYTERGEVVHTLTYI